MKINVEQYSCAEAVIVHSDYQEAEDEFYAEWAEDIRAEEEAQEIGKVALQ